MGKNRPRTRNLKIRPAGQKQSKVEKTRYLPQVTVPWGRSASPYRPGLFMKRYLVEHGEVSAADVFSALKEALTLINQERVEVGEKPIRGCTYNSFAKYWHWFKILGLIESTGKTEAAMYDFLEKKRFFRLTSKGRNEVKAWEDPIMATHPEFR